MNTKDFFDVVLPSQGAFCVDVPVTKGFRHYFFDSHESAAEVALGLDQRKLVNVYMACASFKDRSSRKQANVAFVRSFWLDIDCGPTKPYPTQYDAAKALVDFTKAVGLPVPMVVSSGAGLHIYWPTDQDMPPEAWFETATMLKQATQVAGLQADPSRTSDSASVLRPVGTFNRKPGRDLKEVELLQRGRVATLAEITASLQVYLEGHDALPALPPSKVLSVANNSDLMGGIDYAPKYASLIAEECAAIAEMRDTKGNIAEPIWYACLGVVAFTDGGDEIAHDWSDGHPKYTQAETDTKLAQVRKLAPTSCAKIASLCPDTCKQCPHFEKIKSPIVLGFERQTATAAPAPIAFSAADPISDAFGASTPTCFDPLDIPEPYQWTQFPSGRQSLTVNIPDEKGNDRRIPFSNTLFYPVNRLRFGRTEETITKIDGAEDASYNEYALEIEMVVRGDQRRRFTIPSSLVGEGGSRLAAALAKYEIVARPKMQPNLSSYLSDWMDMLRNTRDEVRTYNHFGWSGHNFVIGDTLLTPAGTEKKILVRESAAEKAADLRPTGSLDVWKQVIEKAYNHAGQEPFQFCVLCGFAAPLVSLLKQPVAGITVHAYSGASGKGKTTAQQAALSAWGNPQQLMLADGKATANSLWTLLGTYHSLPVVVDEMTNQSNENASEFVFSIASGRQKERLDRSGKLRGNQLNWSTIAMTSGNNPLSEKLAGHRANAGAEMMRLFEFPVHCQSHLSPNEAIGLFPLLSENYGHAGRAFAKYVVEHPAEVTDLMQRMQRAFNVRAGLVQQERCWSVLAASTLAALKILRDLNILMFNPATVSQWLLDRIADNRLQTNDAASDPLEMFGKMLSDLWQGVIVTKGQGHATHNAAEVIIHPRSVMTGRVVIPLDKKSERERLYISSGAIRGWCNKNGVSSKEMFDACLQVGYVEPSLVRYALGSGTTQYNDVSSHIRCWVVDPHKACAGVIPDVGRTISQIINGGAEQNGPQSQQC